MKDQQDIEVQGELTYDSTEIMLTTDEIIENIARDNIEIKHSKCLKILIRSLLK
ncbi:MAG: hypothetical protein R2942_13240 [Ignavibacteria bacterium]